MDNTFRISIPTDKDGYVLLQCPLCCCHFKLNISDIESISEIFCPGCGMKSDSYITNEVIELAQAKVINQFEEEIYSIFKGIEKKTRGKMISIKAGEKPKPSPEKPIRNKVEAMDIAYFTCCDKTCKVKNIRKMMGCYCPFCGVKEYEL
ncbi:anaerobic ribonucleoside triphosphate reductase [Oribacterium sp. FC2011]|uniref:anaerobic ribonucleoside triphosphate reductase n=1 Tax=Oribacterium sp. FC2011 TaxID=1408311 RepID=UPI0004E15D4F|nr:anaerobic ribonucleoside triphosphate reductase [Oribacterium sp. FC2011]